VSVEKGVQINHQVFDDIKERQGLNHEIIAGFVVPDQFLAGKINPAVNDHGIRSADPVDTGRPEGQRGILLPSYFIQTIYDLIGGADINAIFLVVSFPIHRGIVAVYNKGGFHFSISFLWAQIE
jgi:hypothetical protein